MRKFPDFKSAFRGVFIALGSEMNMRIHLCAMIYVTLGAIIAGFDLVRWCIILICFALVFSAELLNTAIERYCDNETMEYSEKIRTVKDISAGAVLSAAVFSAIIGGALFFRKSVIAAVIDLAERQPVLFWVLVLSLIPAILFIRGRKTDD